MPVLPLSFSSYVSVQMSRGQAPQVGLMYYDYAHGFEKTELKNQDGGIYVTISNYSSHLAASYFPGEDCNCLAIQDAHQVELDINSSYNYTGNQAINNVDCQVWLQVLQPDTYVTLYVDTTSSPIASLVQYNYTRHVQDQHPIEIITSLSHTIAESFPVTVFTPPPQCDC
eukprot:gene7338-8544_t